MACAGARSYEAERASQARGLSGASTRLTTCAEHGKGLKTRDAQLPWRIGESALGSTRMYLRAAQVHRRAVLRATSMPTITTWVVHFCHPARLHMLIAEAFSPPRTRWERNRRMHSWRQGGCCAFGVLPRDLRRDTASLARVGFQLGARRSRFLDISRFGGFSWFVLSACLQRPARRPPKY